MNTHGLLDFSSYKDEEYFNLEKKSLFSKTWHFIGVESDIAPGRPIKTKILDNPIIVLINKEKKLKGFYNICRHRGTALLQEVNGCINCPYHNWNYNMDGKILSIPSPSTFNHGEGINKEKLSLHEIRVEKYKGLIFINFDSSCKNIVDTFGKVGVRVGGFSSSKYTEIKSYKREFKVKANRKIVVENFIDIYHLSHLHKNTLGDFDHLKMDHFSSQGCWWSFDPYKKDKAINWGLKYGDKNAGEYVHTFFPLTGIHEDNNGNFSLFVMRPISALETIIELRSFSKSGITTNIFNTFFPKYNLDKNKKPLESGDFLLEDIYAMEAQQEAFFSDKFGVGAMSNLEVPIFEFHKEILKYMK